MPQYESGETALRVKQIRERETEKKLRGEKKAVLKLCGVKLRAALGVIRR